MTKKSHMVNRGDGVHINLNAPLRVRDKQMKKHVNRAKGIGVNWGRHI